MPLLKDPNLKIDLITSSLSRPTSMAFIDDNNILVLEKTGSVRLISNGVLQEQPVLNVPIDTRSERGLLGIATVNNTNIQTDNSGFKDRSISVFLYFTEKNSFDQIRNRVYRYEWNGESLVNPLLILDLPAIPGPNHNGGKLMIGTDKYLYVIIGELNHRGKLQNVETGPAPDNTGVILRVNPYDGSPAANNPFINNAVTDKTLFSYYAYGIRNSFGLTFDPVTGIVWETENGENDYDEINIVKPGFNSGWIQIMGPISRSSGITESDLVNFPGSKYDDPVFSWKIPPAVTDIEFLHSSKLGAKYANNIFVGDIGGRDINNGKLYYFTVNEDRNGLKFDASQTGLTDLVADDEEELSAIIFGSGFEGITDIVTGPDGFLYILSDSYPNLVSPTGSNFQGKIYRITPK